MQTVSGPSLYLIQFQIIKQKDKPFVMKWWALDYVFLPAKYLRDLKRADTRDLSFFENISKVSR